MDSSICIRTVLLQHGQASCWGGGGIVMDSEWQAEYEESKTKVRVLLQTLERLSGF
ncbi:Aminodeoxychorismate synthase component 1 [compost metagenome]